MGYEISCFINEEKSFILAGRNSWISLRSSNQIMVPNIFHFTYVINTGAAFSLFADNGEWLRWLSLAVTIGLMLFAWFSPRLPKLEQLGYGFVLAGAAGNGLDRFLFGYVVDFLDFRLIQFPVFNLADICINIGIICLIIVNFPAFQHSRRPKDEE